MKLTEVQKKLVEDNHQLIYGVIHSFKLPVDEYYGLFAIELCKAVQIYNPKKGSLSTLFYNMCRRVYANELRSKNTIKRSNNGVMELTEFNEVYAEELLSEDEYSTSELKMILESICDDKRKLKMVDLKYRGYNNAEIATELKVSKTTISNWSKEIGEKYKQLMEE